TIAAGFRGVVTLLAGPLPKDPNVFLVEEGERGVQSKTLEPGTYYLNPYETRVSMVDCRSRRFNLGQEAEMNFLSADGFPITLDGVVEFRVLPAKVAEMFVKYNEDANGDTIDEEIIAKIITPESRSLCRVGGSKLSGGQFISGDDREKFQTDLDKSLTENCQKQGIEILAVAITSIKPPDDITQPVQQREVAKQKLAQFRREKLQQLSEAKLKVEVVLAEQKKQVAVTLPSKSSRLPRPSSRQPRTRLPPSWPRPRPRPRSSSLTTRPRRPAWPPRSWPSTATARPWPETCCWASSLPRSARSWATRKARSWTSSANSPGGTTSRGRCPLPARPHAQAAVTHPRPRQHPVPPSRPQPASRGSRPRGQINCRWPLPRRTNRELLSIAIPEPGRRRLGGCRPARPGRLLRNLAVDVLPHRSPRGIEPAGPLQGSLAVWYQAPGARGNTRANRCRRPPAPGRHPRGHARQRTPFLLTPRV